MTRLPLHIYQTLIKESFWLFLGIAGFTSVVLLDAWLIGLIGAEELIAVGFAGPILIGCLNLLLALGTGITATIAPLIGRKTNIPQPFFLTLGGLSGLFFAVLLWGGWTYVFSWMQASNEIIDILSPYINAYLPGLPLMGILTAQISILRSWSRMMEAAIVLVTLCLTNAVLDPVLMFSAGIGLAGAAWATTIAALVACITAFFLLRKNPQQDNELPPPSGNLLKTVASVAIPAAALRSLLPLATIWILRWISSINPEFVGAYGVGQRVDLFIMMLPLAISSVASPRIGRSWGEGQGAEVRMWVAGAQRLVLLYGILATICLFLAAPLLSRLWGNEGAITDNLILYFRVMGLAFAGQGVFQIVQNSFYALQRPTLSVIWSCVQVAVWLIIGGIGYQMLGDIYIVLLAWPISLTISAVGAHLHWRLGPGRLL